ncbi:MAG: hypothetical protein JWM50_1664 [Microbacteriaceae bacterium]|nr:hypothetical protein [Microbacteriaceae bacterium]
MVRHPEWTEAAIRCGVAAEPENGAALPEPGVEPCGEAPDGGRGTGRNAGDGERGHERLRPKGSPREISEGQATDGCTSTPSAEPTVSRPAVPALRSDNRTLAVSNRPSSSLADASLAADGGASSVRSVPDISSRATSHAPKSNAETATDDDGRQCRARFEQAPSGSERRTPAACGRGCGDTPGMWVALRGGWGARRVITRHPKGSESRRACRPQVGD